LISYDVFCDIQALLKRLREDPDQGYFWSDEWQTRIEEGEADVQAGRTIQVKGDDIERALASAVAILVNLYLPENNGWIAILILGAGAFVIAAIPNRRVEVNVAHLMGIIVVVIGFLISPLRTLWKIVFIVVSVLLAAYFVWLDREDMQHLFASQIDAMTSSKSWRRWGKRPALCSYRSPTDRVPPPFTIPLV
jgi:Flp pilus assembly protein TadB